MFFSACTSPKSVWSFNVHWSLPSSKYWISPPPSPQLTPLSASHTLYSYTLREQHKSQISNISYLMKSYCCWICLFFRLTEFQPGYIYTLSCLTINLAVTMRCHEWTLTCWKLKFLHIIVNIITFWSIPVFTQF